MKAKWGFGSAVAPSPSQSNSSRLRKLAQRIDALARKDESVIERAREVATLRRQAALELYGICADFVRALNELLAMRTALVLDPDDYHPDSLLRARPPLPD